MALSTATLTRTAPVAADATGDPGTACVRYDRAASDLSSFLEDALRVVRQSGRDPSAYQLEIRRDFVGTSDPTRPLAGPLVRAVFAPRDTALDYAVEVRPDHPCAVTWVWDPRHFLPWQRDAIDRALEVALERDSRSEGPRAIEVVESVERLGFALYFGDADAGAELHILLRKNDLFVLEWRKFESHEPPYSDARTP